MLTSHADCWVFESQLRQIQVLKTGSDSSIAKQPALVSVSQILRNDRYKWMPHVTVWHAKDPSLLNGRVPSIGQNLRPFTEW